MLTAVIQNTEYLRVIVFAYKLYKYRILERYPLFALSQDVQTPLYLEVIVLYP
jgi:hypothetical protein